MKKKLSNQLKAMKSVRKPMPKPTAVIKTKKQKAKTDRKGWKKDME